MRVVRARLNKLIHDVVLDEANPRTVEQYKALYGYMWEQQARYERDYDGRISSKTRCGIYFRHKLLPDTFQTTCLECIGTPFTNNGTLSP